MAVSSISSSSSLSQSLQTWQAKAQKIQNEFQQLGQDLQAGNLTQAQSDFSTLSKNISSPLQSNSALAQAFTAVGSALQSGSLATAQQAYATLQQGVQQTARALHRHGQSGSGSQTAVSSTVSTLSQAFNSLSSALQAGNLSAAQTAYSALSQDVQQAGAITGSSTSLAAALSLLG